MTSLHQLGEEYRNIVEFQWAVGKAIARIIVREQDSLSYMLQEAVSDLTNNIASLSYL